MAWVQIHRRTVKNYEWAISSVRLLHLPSTATTAKSLPTNPKSPQVHPGPPGKPRSSKPPQLRGVLYFYSPQLKITSEGAQGAAAQLGEVIPRIHREYQINTRKKEKESFLLWYFSTITNQIKWPFVISCPQCVLQTALPFIFMQHILWKYEQWIRLQKITASMYLSIPIIMNSRQILQLGIQMDTQAWKYNYWCMDLC